MNRFPFPITLLRRATVSRQNIYIKIVYNDDHDQILLLFNFLKIIEHLKNFNDAIFSNENQENLKIFDLPNIVKWPQVKVVKHVKLNMMMIFTIFIGALVMTGLQENSTFLDPFFYSMVQHRAML